MLNNPMGFDKEIYKALRVYEDLLKTWQNKFNLISNNTVNDIWNRHIIDCAQLFNLLPREKEEKKIYDFGTGAGLPGLILAIMGRSDIVLYESNKKKCIFLEEVKKVLKLNVIIDNIRAESLSFVNANMVLARAVAPLEKLLLLVLPVIQAGGTAIFPKGKNWNQELMLAQKDFIVEYDLVKSITSQDSYIFVIKYVEKKIEKI